MLSQLDWILGTSHCFPLYRKGEGGNKLAQCRKKIEDNYY